MHISWCYRRKNGIEPPIGLISAQRAKLAMKKNKEKLLNPHVLFMKTDNDDGDDDEDMITQT
jgi:hypothetical protein